MCASPYVNRVASDMIFAWIVVALVARSDSAAELESRGTGGSSAYLSARPPTSAGMAYTKPNVEITSDSPLLSRNLPMQKTNSARPEPETRLPSEKRTSKGTSATSPRWASSLTGTPLPNPPKSMRSSAARSCT